MKIKFLVLIMAFGSVGTSIPMDDGSSFMCKISSRDDERSLPAGAIVPVASAKVIDQKKRAEKIAELNSDAVRNLPWKEQKKLLKDAMKNYGIHHKEITTWRPFLKCIIDERDNSFSLFLIDQGLEINWTRVAMIVYGVRGIERRGRLAILKRLLRSLEMESQSKEEALESIYPNSGPQSVLLAHKCGSNPAYISATGNTALISLLKTYKRTNDKEIVNERIASAKKLVALGVPLNARVTSGSYQGCDYKDILDRNFPDTPAGVFNLKNTMLKDEMLNAINEACAKNQQMRAQFLAIVELALLHNLKGPQAVDNLIIEYVGHIIPDDVLAEIEQLDAQADRELARLRAENAKGDEDENADDGGKSKCVIQ